MTTTVRILGLRAREQMPGTSITLRAPGFRGAMTQLEPGESDPGMPDLPFSESAPVADLMLAAQLAMDLEARPPDDGLGLRARSAAAAYPRLIVPRRRGVAYALLQTESGGPSSFVFADLGDEDEVVFPLTIRDCGAVRRTLRVLMWPAQQVAGPGAPAVMGRWERLRRAHQLLQLGADGHWRAPDWATLPAGPVLLLLHGTFGTPRSAFSAWTDDASFAPVRARYGTRILALAHPTVSSSPEENLGWLLAHLPRFREPIDLIGHGRGGLLARVIAANGGIPVGRACLVGTPNDGSALADPERLGDLLGAHVAPLTRAPPPAARATLEGALCMTRFVAMRLLESWPGIEPMRPRSALLGALADPRHSARQCFTVGAHWSRASGDGDIPGDGVVSSEGCHALGFAPADSLRIAGAEAHHHNYFSLPQVREKLATWLA
jgi:pimeloyl-ACP methyl ester carboxylesterase